MRRPRLHIPYKDTPNTDAQLHENWKEIERWADRALRLDEVVRDMPFVLTGALFLTTSPRYYPAGDGCTFTESNVSLATAGTSSTVVTIYVDGVAYTTVTLTSGQTYKQTAHALDLVSTSYVQVGVTTIGTAARDLDCQLKFLAAE